MSMDDSEPPAKRIKRPDAPPTPDVKARPIKSCLRCRHRKVRCDQGRPCRNCLRRKEPDLCQYTEEDDQPPSGTGAAAAAPQASLATQAHIRAATAGKSNNASPLVHERIVRPLLEDNGDASDSYSNGDARAGTNDDDVEILPRDVMKYGPFACNAATSNVDPSRLMQDSVYEAFMLRAHQFVPIILSPTELAENVCKFAQGGGTSTRLKAPRRDYGLSNGQKALLYAVLASGAQYSDFPRPRREELLRHFCQKPPYLSCVKTH